MPCSYDKYSLIKPQNLPVMLLSAAGVQIHLCGPKGFNMQLGSLIIECLHESLLSWCPKVFKLFINPYIEGNKNKKGFNELAFLVITGDNRVRSQVRRDEQPSFVILLLPYPHPPIGFKISKFLEHHVVVNTAKNHLSLKTCLQRNSPNKVGLIGCCLF